MYKEDTIAAIATAPGAGGIGIIRISGRKAFEIADRVFSSPTGKKTAAMPAYTAAFGKLLDKEGQLIDEAIALVMHAPKSYTCEDVVELLAEKTNTINYEIICGISKRVPRVYLKNGTIVQTTDYML